MLPNLIHILLHNHHHHHHLSFVSASAFTLHSEHHQLHHSLTMSHYNQAPLSYPPPVTAYPAAADQASYVIAPPPMGYPTKDASTYPQQSVPDQTTSRGDGFWKGCCAAICCCWVLDCFF